MTTEHITLFGQSSRSRRRAMPTCRSWWAPNAIGATTVSEAIITPAGRQFRRQRQHRLGRPRDTASGNQGKIRGCPYHRKMYL